MDSFPLFSLYNTRLTSFKKRPLDDHTLSDYAIDMNWHTFLVIVHVIGTVFGAGAVTFAGVFYLLKRPVDHLTTLDDHFLKTTYAMLRLGMIMLVLSGFGFLLLLRLDGHSYVLYKPLLWAKLTIVLIILINALLHHVKAIPVLLGSAISAVSWYWAILLGIIRVPLTYLGALGFYLLTIAIAYILVARSKKGIFPII